MSPLMILLLVLAALPVFSIDFLLWLGFSQTGKSTCVRLLTGNESIEVGGSNGWQSVTNKIQVHRENRSMLGETFMHLDTIGFGDTRLVNKDSLIREKIEETVLREASAQGVGRLRAILITESYFSDTIRLQIILNHIKNIFDTVPTESIVVLLTKKNLLSPEMAREKREAIIRIAQKNSIPTWNVIDFATPWDGVSEESVAASIQTLAGSIKACPGFQSTTIVRKYDKIRTRALQLQKLLTKVEKRKIQYQKDEVKTTPVTKYHKVTYKKRRGGIRGIFGGTRTVEQLFPYIQNEVTTIKVQAQKQVDVEIIPEFEEVFTKSKEEFQESTMNFDL